MPRDASREAAEVAQVTLRLVPDAESRAFLIDARRIAGVKKVEQTFPGDDDAYLASIYVADIEPALLSQALRKLRTDERVESVERPAPRKLIRSRQ